MAKQYSISTRMSKYLQSSKNRSYFTLAVTFLFVVLVILVGIVPAYSAVSFQYSENNKREEVISQLEKKLADLKTMSVEYREKNTIINYLNEVLPDQFTQDVFILELNELAKENSVFLQSINFADTFNFQKDLSVSFGVSQNIEFVSVSLYFEGNNTGIVNFLGDIENSTRILNVTNLVITKKVGTELRESIQGREYKVSMNLEYYYVNKPSL